MNRIKNICRAYNAGMDAYLLETKTKNPYSSVLERDEHEAWTIGYMWNTEHDEDIDTQDAIKYSLISYRVIQASGSIKYHYALIDFLPEVWLVNHFINFGGKDHYSIQNIIEVSEEFYIANKGMFVEGVE